MIQQWNSQQNMKFADYFIARSCEYYITYYKYVREALNKKGMD